MALLFAFPVTNDFFRSRIDQTVDLPYPLAVLVSRMPWQEIEAHVVRVFFIKGRSGRHQEFITTVMPWD